MIPLWSINSIATGNSLILKPSERDPGAAMIIAELAEKAGTLLFSESTPLRIPSECLNLIHLYEHPQVSPRVSSLSSMDPFPPFNSSATSLASRPSPSSDPTRLESTFTIPLEPTASVCRPTWEPRVSRPRFLSDPDERAEANDSAIIQTTAFSCPTPTATLRLTVSSELPLEVSFVRLSRASSPS